MTSMGTGVPGGPEPAPGGRRAGGRQAQVQALGPRASDCCPPRPRDHAFPSLTPAAGGIWFRRPEDTNTPPTVPELREARAGEQTEAPAKGRAQPPRRRAPPARPEADPSPVPTSLSQEKTNTPVLNIFTNSKMVVIVSANVSLCA